MLGKTALAAVERHSAAPVVATASFTRPVSTPVQVANDVVKSQPATSRVNTFNNVQAAPVQLAVNTVTTDRLQAAPASTNIANNSVAAPVVNSFVETAAAPAIVTAAAKPQVVETDPLLALMNKGSRVAEPVVIATAPSSQITPQNTVDTNFAANAVREAIAREDAKEAREMERLAKLRTENEKRERQLANASQHKVNSGDTLYSIAKTYDMSMSELLAANGLSDNNIKVGQTLVVGKAAERAIQTAKAKEQKQQQANMNYVVRKGDTLNSIAGKFNLKVNDLRKLNNGNNIRPGQKIQLRQL